MLVKNFYTLMKTIFIAGADSKDISFTLTNYAGGQVKKYPSELAGYGMGFFTLYSDLVYTTNPHSTGIYLGSGAGAVTVDDYCLQSPICGGEKISYISSYKLDTSGGLPAHISTLVITNAESSKTITIAELGFFYYGGLLLDRTVLDSPVVLAPGQVATIKYRITNASVLNT